MSMMSTLDCKAVSDIQHYFAEFCHLPSDLLRELSDSVLWPKTGLVMSLKEDARCLPPLYPANHAFDTRPM